MAAIRILATVDVEPLSADRVAIVQRLLDGWDDIQTDGNVVHQQGWRVDFEAEEGNLRRRILRESRDVPESRDVDPGAETLGEFRERTDGHYRSREAALRDAGYVDAPQVQEFRRDIAWVYAKRVGGRTPYNIAKADNHAPDSRAVARAIEKMEVLIFGSAPRPVEDVSGSQRNI